MAMGAMALAPKGACDTHTHVFGDASEFPMSPGRAYTPPEATPEQMLAMHRKLGVERVVIVTPSVYGTDNRATLYGMKARGRSARGVAVIDEKTSEGELDNLGAAGVCGVRINLGAPAPSAGAAERLTRMLDRVSGRGWHVQLFAGLAVVEAVETVIAQAPVPVVMDHVAAALPAQGLEQAGFGALLRVVGSGKAYVKVTHRFLPSGTGPEYRDSSAMLRALLRANADRVLWGTDWPHPDSRQLPGRKTTDIAPFEDVDDAAWFERFRAMAGDAKTLEKILVENPGRLYRF